VSSLLLQVVWQQPLLQGVCLLLLHGTSHPLLLLPLHVSWMLLLLQVPSQRLLALRVTWQQLLLQVA